MADLDGRRTRIDEVIPCRMVRTETAGPFVGFSYIQEVKTGNVWIVKTERLPHLLAPTEPCFVVLSRLVEVRRRTLPHPRAGQVIE